MAIGKKRNEISEIDEKIVRLLKRRAEVARDLADEKRKAGYNIEDSGQERKVIRRAKKRGRGGFSNHNSEQLGNVFREIIELTKREMAEEPMPETDSGESLPVKIGTMAFSVVITTILIFLVLLLLG